MHDKVFKNGPSKICGRELLKNFTWSILKYFISCVSFVAMFNPSGPLHFRKSHEIKINLNFYFHISLLFLKRFYESLFKAFIKPFETPQKK